LEYNTDLFDRDRAQRLLEHYSRLLGWIVTKPEARVMSYELLSEEEKRRQLAEWNSREAEYPREKCIHELFEEQVSRTPEAVAVRYADEAITYRQLNERSNRLAHYLMEQGVGEDSRVGLCMERSVELAVGVLGILKAGGAYVLLDPACPGERLGYLLEDSAVELIVTQSSVWPQVDWEPCGIESGRVRCVWVDAEDAQGACSSADPVRHGSARSLACVMYESDRSGVPLGVMVSHMGLLAGALGRGEERCEDWIASLWAWPASLLSGAGVDLSAIEPKSVETGCAAHYVLDSHAQLLPVGAVGELYVGCAGVCGYLNRAALTAQRFVPNPYSSEPGARLYRTGEQARWMSDGSVERIAATARSGGDRAGAKELRELERVLLGHAGVEDAVVLAVDGVQRRRAGWHMWWSARRVKSRWSDSPRN